jgi:hypothetical protein
VVLLVQPRLHDRRLSFLLPKVKVLRRIPSGLSASVGDVGDLGLSLVGDPADDCDSDRRRLSSAKISSRETFR